MKFREFLLLMKTPILLVILMIIIFSFMSYFFGFQLILVKDRGVLMWIIHGVFYQLDYTHDLSLATWFISFMMLIIASGFFLIGWGDREKLKISSTRQWFIRLFSVIAFILSADEILLLREQLGKKIEDTTTLLDKINVEHLGHSWLLVYIPLALIGTVVFIFVFNNLIKNIKSVSPKFFINRYLSLIILLVPVYFIFAFVGRYLMMSGNSISVIPYFEGILKMGMIYCFYSFVLKIIESYNL
ncbi:MAG: hypothetical protein KAS53_06755 [Candidatus Cloacimonetes bacterium]|nr:hypothetical protein [Candidatus Cloacimonadota bacterium]